MKKNDAERKHLRDYIKSNAADGETPAITFLLTPYSENGHTIPDDMSGVSAAALWTIKAMCEELVADGIAVFLCLYPDDCVPRWYFIGGASAIWKKVHEKVGDIVNGYILSIETNEQATSKSHIESCIAVMREAMPGADYYGTHLQWTANNGKYRWLGGSTTPGNINMLLVETSWDPRKGDNISVEKLKSEYGAIKAANPDLKLIIHEYNINAGSATEKAQRAYLRSQKAWGVG